MALHRRGHLKLVTASPRVYIVPRGQGVLLVSLEGFLVAKESGQSFHCVPSTRRRVGLATGEAMDKPGDSSPFPMLICMGGPWGGVGRKPTNPGFLAYHRRSEYD